MPPNPRADLISRLPVFILFLFFLGAPSLFAEMMTREDLLAKYEKTVSLAEELNIYQEDIYKVLPKLRLASNALLRDDFTQANHMLDEAFADLKILKTQKPMEIRSRFKLEWLEIYAEVFQKYAVLVLLAYLFSHWPFFAGMLQQNRITAHGKFLLPVLTGVGAILLSLFDLTRYGESAWAFLDIQLIFLAIGGLLGGMTTGLFSGIIVGIFRWVLKPEFWIYPSLAVAAGILGGVFSRDLKNYRAAGRVSFLVGALVGAIHGMVIYLPTARLIPLSFILISVLFLALLEGGGVFLFFAVISGILREYDRRRAEEDHLKTKLLFLQAQIQPHFLFNALNTISAICGREKASQSQTVVLQLANFLRRTLKRVDESVTLKEEMEYIDSYLQIEKARFQERLQIFKDFKIQDAAWSARIPVLILQPLVENAVKHGISQKEEGGKVELRLSEAKGAVEIEIQDNGVGMSSDLTDKLFTGTSNGEGTGIGIKNIQNRLVQIYGPEYGLQFQSEPGQGTRVKVRIPLDQGAKP